MNTKSRVVAFLLLSMLALVPEQGFGQETNKHITELIDDFRSDNPETADKAYHKLFHQGAKAIGPLLEVTSDTRSNYIGAAHQNEHSSRLLMEAPRLALTALYLIDGILLGLPAPHIAPVLLSEQPLDSETKLHLAIGAYQRWWNGKEDLSLKELREMPGPLESMPIRWQGPLLFAPQDAPRTGKKKPGSETPAATDRGALVCLSNPDGPDPDAKGDDYAWTLRPGTPGGATPYNCFAWAIACHTDRRINTGDDANGKTYEDVLRDYGYDEKNPVDCDGKCPEGKGSKVKIIFHSRIPENPFHDSKWVHVMKQEEDGDWTSKNGDQGPLWQDITDCEKFLDRDYPVPKGQFRDKRCYCKK